MTFLEDIGRKLFGSGENAVGGVTPWQDVGFLQKFGMGLGGPDVVRGYQEDYTKAVESAALETKKSKLAELAQLNDPGAMLRGMAESDPSYLAKYADYIVEQRKPKAPQAPLTSGLPEGYMWNNGKAIKIPGVTLNTKPQSPQGQLQADYNAGFIDEETYQKAINKAGKTADVPGYEPAEGIRPTADDAKKVKAVITAKERLDSQLGDYEAALNKYGTTKDGLNVPILAGTKAAQELERKQTGIRFTLKELEGLGSLQGGEISEMQTLMGTPVIGGQLSDFNPISSVNKAGQGTKIAKSSVSDMRKYIDTRVNATVNNYGYKQSSNANEAPSAPAASNAGAKILIFDKQGNLVQ